MTSLKSLVKDTFNQISESGESAIKQADSTISLVKNGFPVKDITKLNDDLMVIKYILPGITLTDVSVKINEGYDKIMVSYKNSGEVSDWESLNTLTPDFEHLIDVDIKNPQMHIAFKSGVMTVEVTKKTT